MTTYDVMPMGRFYVLTDGKKALPGTYETRALAQRVADEHNQREDRS